LLAHREAQRKYRQTEKGKAAHIESEKRRRLAKAGEGRFRKTYEALVECCKSTVEIAKSAIENLLAQPGKTDCCHICHKHGSIVQNFNRCYIYKQTLEA
jgi:hypothetical protein